MLRSITQSELFDTLQSIKAVERRMGRRSSEQEYIELFRCLNQPSVEGLEPYLSSEHACVRQAAVLMMGEVGDSRRRGR